MTIPILTLAAFTGCEEGSRTIAGDLTISVDTVRDIIHTNNTGTPPDWRLTPVVSIGPKSVAETGAPEEFGRVTSVAVGPDGTLFVADGINREVRVFGPEGRLLGSVAAPPRKEGSVPVFGAGYLVTVRQDSLDLGHVDVWRIERTGR